MADRLVDLQRHLVRVEDDRRHDRRAHVRGQQRFCLLGDPRRLRGEIEAFDVLPAALRARPDVGAGIAPQLEHAVANGRAVDPAAALDQLLLDVGPLGGDQNLVLALGSHHRPAQDEVSALERLLRAQAVLDLLGQRDVERIPLHGRPVCAGVGRDRSEGARIPPAGRARERARAQRGVAGPVRGEPPVAGEAPRAAGEHADADALALAVAQRLDATVLRRHRLVAAQYGARVGVLRPGAQRRVHRRPTQIVHRPDSSRRKPQLRSYNAPALRRWWRNW